MKKSIIVGGGEIGRSLYDVLSKQYNCDLVDLDETKCINNPCNEDFTIDILHICFPYTEGFEEEVLYYQNKYNPEQTVIHSTVPVGTSRKLNCVHSPVQGLHPFLSESIQTFTKYLSGPQASEVTDYFRRANIKVYITDKQETTEYMKIMDTTFYGMMIEFHKQVKEDCNRLDIPFEMFTLWNMNYNESYEKLGYPEYKKPLLVPVMKKIGQHCVMPNTNLLENDFTRLIKKRNSNLK